MPVNATEDHAICLYLSRSSDSAVVWTLLLLNDDRLLSQIGVGFSTAKNTFASASSDFFSDFLYSECSLRWQSTNFHLIFPAWAAENSTKNQEKNIWLWLLFILASKLKYKHFCSKYSAFQFEFHYKMAIQDKFKSEFLGESKSGVVFTSLLILKLWILFPGLKSSKIWQGGNGYQGIYIGAEMQKAADAADISVLFFQLVLIFGPFWVIFGPNWAILGHFWAILGDFRSFLGHFLVVIFCGKICICAI